MVHLIVSYRSVTNIHTVRRVEPPHRRRFGMNMILLSQATMACSRLLSFSQTLYIALVVDSHRWADDFGT